MSLATPAHIRLSQIESTNVTKNGDYEVILASTETIYEGDSVIPYQCIFNTGIPSNETVQLADDISLSVSYLYYEQNTDFTDKTNINGSEEDDNEIYIMHHSDPNGTGVNRVIGTQAINLPSGNYTPEGLAQYITDEFSNTRSTINATSLSTGNNLLIATDTGSGGGTITKFDEFSWGNKPYPFSSVPNLEGSQESWGQDGTGVFQGTPYYLATGIPGAGGYGSSAFPGGNWVSMAPGRDELSLQDSAEHDFHITSTGTNGNGTGCVIRIRPLEDKGGGWVGPNYFGSQGDRFVVTIVDGGQDYQRGDEVYFEYNQFGAVNTSDDTAYRLGSNKYPVTATNGVLKLVVDSIAEATSYYEFLKLGDDPDAPADSYRYNDGEVYWIGATEFNLSYNEDGNGKFAFDYIHTPFYQATPGQPLQPAVLIKREVASDSTINVDCGIALTALTPVSFWQGILNFDLDSILVKDVDGRRIDGSIRSVIDNIDNARTTGYLGLNGYLINTGAADSQIRKLPAPTQGSRDPVATTLTNKVEANEFINNSGSGYFIVDIQGAYVQRLTTGGKHNVQCSAVVTRQYNSFSMITAYAESAIPYIHSGPPITLKSMRVRLLNPDTTPMKVYDNLGPNNSVFLKIERGQSYVESQLSELQLEELSKK